MRNRVKYIIDKITIVITVAILFVGCTKESNNNSRPIDKTENRPISLLPYTPILSYKGAVVDNSTITANGFNVSVYKMSTDLTNAEKYIPCTEVKYNTTTNKWGYIDKDGNQINRYWPADNSKLTFLAHYPSEGTEIGTDGKTPLFGNKRYEAFDAANNDTDLAFKFNYTVHSDANKQYDLIYALRENVECPEDAPYSVHLPFCHALTQVAFTAQLNSNLPDISIKVYEITLHNLTYTGTFAVKNSTGDELTNDTSSGNGNYKNNGIWRSAKSGDTPQGADNNLDTNREEYLISEFNAIVKSGIELTTTPKAITEQNNELMLIPQHITAWEPDGYKPSKAPFKNAYNKEINIDNITRTDGSTGLDPLKAGAYLAISCEITQTVNGKTNTIHHKEKLIYAPLTTSIDYKDGNGKVNEWLAGYKITYNLIFGGGYTTIPGAEYPVKTLTPITVSATASDWNVVTPNVPLTY